MLNIVWLFSLIATKEDKMSVMIVNRYHPNMVDQDNSTTERDSTELAGEQANIQGRSYTH